MSQQFEKLKGIEQDNLVLDDWFTIGLILCSKKNEAVAKYSVLSDGRKIFAAKYLDYLPTEEQLQRELERERRLLEETGMGTDRPKGKR